MSEIGDSQIFLLFDTSKWKGTLVFMSILRVIHYVYVYVSYKRFAVFYFV